MKGLGTKATFLFLSLTLATAVLGSAYTLWFEDLRLEANVTTTTLDGEILCGQVGDNEATNWPAPPSGQDPFGEYPEGPKLGPGGTLKDVATSIVSDGGEDFPHEWSLIVGNTYPGYALDCEVEIFNTAPLPWHVEDMTVTVEECEVPNGPCVLLDAWELVCDLDEDCTWGDLGINPPNYPDGLDEWSPVYVEVESFLGCQLHQGDDLAASLFIGVNQSAKENVKYVITLSYQVNQWNESIWDGCGSLKDPV